MTADDISCLIVMSSPDGAERLRLDVEARVLEKIAFQSKQSESPFKIIHAARSKDIFDILSRQKFSCIQFSGHGSPAGLFMEAEKSASGTLIDVDVVSRMLKEAQPHLSAALFMSCYSAEMADTLIDSIPIIISCDGPADDLGCVSFLQRFYSSLLNSNDIEKSFRIAQAANFGGGLDPILQRRSKLSKNNSALIRSDGPDGNALYVDISKVKQQAHQFEMSENELVRLIGRKIYYHRWAFRYPRERALFPVGHLFAHFTWENAADVVYCDKLYRLRGDVDNDACAVWIELMTRYHDCYVSEYRSPIKNFRTDEKSNLASAIATMERLNNSFFNGAYYAMMCDYALDIAKMARPICLASIKIAEEKLMAGDIGGSIQNLEMALSAIHDLVEGFGKSVLE